MSFLPPLFIPLPKGRSLIAFSVQSISLVPIHWIWLLSHANAKSASGTVRVKSLVGLFSRKILQPAKIARNVDAFQASRKVFYRFFFVFLFSFFFCFLPLEFCRAVETVLKRWSMMSLKSSDGNQTTAYTLFALGQITKGKGERERRREKKSESEGELPVKGWEIGKGWRREVIGKTGWIILIIVCRLPPVRFLASLSLSLLRVKRSSISFPVSNENLLLSLFQRSTPPPFFPLTLIPSLSPSSFSSRLSKP